MLRPALNKDRLNNSLYRRTMIHVYINMQVVVSVIRAYQGWHADDRTWLGLVKILYYVNFRD